MNLDFHRSVVYIVNCHPLIIMIVTKTIIQGDMAKEIIDSCTFNEAFHFYKVGIGSFLFGLFHGSGNKIWIMKLTNKRNLKWRASYSDKVGFARGI